MVGTSPHLFDPRVLVLFVVNHLTLVKNNPTCFLAWALRLLLLGFLLFFGHEVCGILGLGQLQGLMNTHSTSENDKLMAYAKGGV